MPQLNFSTFLPQAFWFLIAFGAFFAFATYYFIPKVNQIISVRMSTIDSNLEMASKIADKICKIENEIKDISSNYRKEIDSLTRAMKLEIDEIKKSMDGKLEEESHDMMIKTEENVKNLAQMLEKDRNTLTERASSTIVGSLNSGFKVIQSTNSLN